MHELKEACHAAAQGITHVSQVDAELISPPSDHHCVLALNHEKVSNTAHASCDKELYAVGDVKRKVLVANVGE